VRAALVFLGFTRRTVATSPQIQERFHLILSSKHRTTLAEVDLVMNVPNGCRAAKNKAKEIVTRLKGMKLRVRSPAHVSCIR